MFSTTTIHAATDTAIDATIIAAYQATHYHVNGLLPFTLRIGIASAELKKLYKASNTNSGTFITACNPYSVALSEAENQERQTQLSTELRKRSLKFCDAEGQPPDGNGLPKLVFLSWACH